VSAPAPYGGDVVIADTSVWRRADRLPAAVKDEFERALVNQQIATSPVIVCELLYYARRDLARFHQWYERLSAISRNFVPDQPTWSFVTEAYVELAAANQLTGVSLTDIVVAATATRQIAFPVLHLDKDYERLRALSCLSFEARRIVPEGVEI
jgi:predicted nucleic acid-binding protein